VTHKVDNNKIRMALFHKPTSIICNRYAEFRTGMCHPIYSSVVNK